MGFDPQPDRFPYPEITDRHYLVLKKNNGAVFDEHYPFVDDSLFFRFKAGFLRLVEWVFGFWFVALRMGLRVKGRDVLKRHRDLLRQGAVSCCNHVFMLDFVAVTYALRPARPKVLVWAPNIRGENGRYIRWAGGIPVPDEGARATQACLHAVGDLLNSGRWLHIFAEGSMWEWYAPIRPFKRGAAFLACRYGKPLLPMAFSYRPAGWLRRKLFNQTACMTLTIGEPLLADETLPKKERELDLQVRSHQAVCRLAGIAPEDNIYPPVFHQTRRVDYYTDTYGVGYKGSW